jgi:large subunit ribosomal protein L35
LPKQKTHKGAAKRFKITGTGKVMRHQAEVRHGLTQKSQKRKRKLGKAVECSPAFSAILRSMLHR